MKNPLFAAINLQGKPCVIIGGGQVAHRKAKKLVDCGAVVTAIAPAFTDGLNNMALLGQLTRRKKRYMRGDIRGAYLVVIATDDKAVNMEALSEAKELDILINAAFDKQYGNIFFAATKEIAGFTVAAIGKDGSPKESLDLLGRINKSINTEDNK